MSQSNFDHLDIKDDFEFNDGVGDVLKEKESYTFSWQKTAIVLGSITVTILILTFIVLELAKKALDLNKASLEIAVESNELIDKLAIEESENTDWEVLPDIIEDEETIEIVNKPINPKPEVPSKKDIVSKVPPKSTVVINKKVNQTYRVIAGSFTKFSNAKNQTALLKRKGVDSFIWEDKSSNKTLYKLQVGAFKSYDSAQQHVRNLKKKKVDAYILK